jgi:hypothetical protein
MLTKNKELIKKLYQEYKQNYLNELYDNPLQFKKDNNTKYVVYSNDKELAYFLFTFRYDINNSPIDYKKYKLDKYWDVSWYWVDSLPKIEKNSNNFIKVTSTSFKIIDDFIRNNNYPPLLGFGGLTEQHERIYSNQLFLDRWKFLLGERYYTEWDSQNDKVWIINKNFYKIDEIKIYKASQVFKKSPSLIFQEEKYPIKNKLKGINYHNLIKEQIKRVILKQIYLK